ncbi:hypothetical protein Bca101_073703 [Brassica carinata]
MATSELIVVTRISRSFTPKASDYYCSRNKRLDGRDVVARLVKTLGANCHAPGFDARRRGTAHPVIKCGTGCWALSPAQV